MFQSAARIVASLTCAGRSSWRSRRCSFQSAARIVASLTLNVNVYRRYLITSFNPPRGSLPH